MKRFIIAALKHESASVLGDGNANNGLVAMSSHWFSAWLYDKAALAFLIIGVKSGRATASDTFYVAELGAVKPHLKGQIYLHLSDQALTNSLIGITSVFIHVAYYNNWVISL